MELSLLKSKLHEAVVTKAEPKAAGGVVIDADLMGRVRLLPYERILVNNLSNGERFESWAVPGPAGSGAVCLTGAAAALGKVGDHLTILAFALVREDESASRRPLMLMLDGQNRPADGLLDP